MTKYRVAGTTAFLGYQPGDTFEADLDPGQERRALERGSIKKVGATPAKPKLEQQKEEGDE